MTELGSLSVRGLIYREGEVYVAHSIEPGTAVQGDSVDDVKRRLRQAVGSYLERVAEIYQEGDRQEALALLHRKAPLTIRAKYHWALLRSQFPTSKPPRHQVWKDHFRLPTFA